MVPRLLFVKDLQLGLLLRQEEFHFNLLMEPGS